MLQNLPMLLSYKLQMNLGKAALIAVLGIVIVFAVLAVLVGILTLFKLVFRIQIGKKHETPVAPAESNAAASETQSEDDADEIMAVIMAAIACMEQEETVQAPFRVKSIRQVK